MNNPIASDAITPKISDIFQITLLGMSFYGDPFDTHTGWDEENQIGHLWKRFGAFFSRHPDLKQKLKHPNVAFEAHIYDPETGEKGLFEVFVGVELDTPDFKDIPVELSIKILPATQYAIFTFKGQEITSDWEKILQDWLLTSGYQSRHSYNFQYYDERFKSLDNLEESILDVYVPIEKAF